MGNLATDAHFESLALLLDEILQQKRSLQLGTKNAQQLKSHAIVSAKIYRQGGGAAAANQAGGCGIPLWVRDLRSGHLPMGDFARWKQHEHPSLLQPGQRLPKGATVRFPAIGIERLVRLKWIDKNAVLLQLRDFCEQKIGQYLHVSTHSREQHRQNRAVKHAVGMIGHHHDRTSGRNMRLIAGLYAQG